MYRDAGYGENWQPTPNNNARRLDPYTRSCAVLGCFFAIGFVLIVIVVLSLIPVYISRGTSPQRTTVQVSKVYISGYTLTLNSPSDTVNVEAIMSDIANRQPLQAALTALIQSDTVLAGSVVEITKSSRKRRRSASDPTYFTIDLNVTSVKSCMAPACLNQYHLRLLNLICGKNRQISNVHYEQKATLDTAWSSKVLLLNYQLPPIAKSSVAFTTVDPKSVSSLLDTLLSVDKSLNRPPTDNIITSTASILG